MIGLGGGIVGAAAEQAPAAASSARSAKRKKDFPLARIFILDRSRFMIRIVDTEKQML
jgi:hypothetical protein